MSIWPIFARKSISIFLFPFPFPVLRIVNKSSREDSFAIIVHYPYI